MRTLTIDLQEGFAGDEVLVRVNGSEVARRSDVRTKRMVGLACSVDVPVPDGPVTLEVEVPTKGVRGAADVRRSCVGVSVEGSGVRFIESDEPFGYG
jgi:hypothetical protein